MNDFSSIVFYLASQMWCLGRHLPFLIGHLVTEEDPRWECFLLLLDIMDLLFAPVTSDKDTATLRQMISVHHSTFRELYPQRSITPKMHYLVHCPEWIERLVKIP